MNNSFTHSKPRLMFITSPDGGLAHYVVHLWQQIAGTVEPVYVTYDTAINDELVTRHVGETHKLIDPARFGTIDNVVALADRLNIQSINLHAGTRVKLYGDYFFALLSALRHLGVRIVMHLHDVGIHNGPENGPSTISRLSRLADSVLVGAAGEQALLRQLNDHQGTDIQLMNHGPYRLMDQSLFDRDRARDYLGIPPHLNVILSFGAFRREKRLEDLYEAFLLLLRKMPDSRLLIQGDTRYATDQSSLFERLASHPAVMLRQGYASLKTVEAMFKATDVVALPYERTAASGVLNLARAFSRPVVISDSFEHARAIEGACGVVAETGNPVSLCEALYKALGWRLNGSLDYLDAWSSILPEENWEKAASNLLSSSGLLVNKKSIYQSDPVA